MQVHLLLFCSILHYCQLFLAEIYSSIILASVFNCFACILSSFGMNRYLDGFYLLKRYIFIDWISTICMHHRDLKLGSESYQMIDPSIINCTVSFTVRCTYQKDSGVRSIQIIDLYCTFYSFYGVDLFNWFISNLHTDSSSHCYHLLFWQLHSRT